MLRPGGRICVVFQHHRQIQSLGHALRNGRTQPRQVGREQHGGVVRGDETGDGHTDSRDHVPAA